MATFQRNTVTIDIETVRIYAVNVNILNLMVIVIPNIITFWKHATLTQPHDRLIK